MAQPLHGAVAAVDSVRIRSAAAADPSLPKKAAVITHALDRQIRDSYNAYVVFAEASSVARAVATNGALFEGRHLRIDRLAGAAAASNRPRPPARPPAPPPPRPPPRVGATQRNVGSSLSLCLSLHASLQKC